MRTSTHALANRYDIAAQVTGLKLNQFFVSGGLPIIVDDQLIGAIGVGGSNMDEQCAHVALTAVLGPQPPLAEDQTKDLDICISQEYKPEAVSKTQRQSRPAASSGFLSKATLRSGTGTRTLVSHPNGRYR